MTTAVLFSVRELHHGGIERDVTNVALHLDRAKWEPHVAFFASKGFRYHELQAADIPLLHIPVKSLTSVAAISSAMILRKYIRDHRIAIVHTWDNSGIYSVPIARLASVRVVLGSQLGHRTLTDKRSLRLVRLTDHLIDAMVVNCEAMRRHLIEDEKYPACRIELCYNGVDASKFSPGDRPRRVTEVQNASIVVGTVCVLREVKAIDLLQEAFARLRSITTGMKLLVVGSGPELSRLQSNAVRLGIARDNVFVPSTADVPSYLRSIDIFVSSSRSEAFSNALLEAMACGCSIIGSRVGGTPEMLGNDERGLLFTPGDTTALAHCLERLILDSDLRASLSRKAAAFVSTELSIKRTCECLSAIYEKWMRRLT